MPKDTTTPTITDVAGSSLLVGDLVYAITGSYGGTRRLRLARIVRYTPKMMEVQDIKTRSKSTKTGEQVVEAPAHIQEQKDFPDEWLAATFCKD